MSYAGKRDIVSRIEAIAAWRRERGEQDLFGFGSDVAARHARSATALDELVKYVDGLDSDDERIVQLEQLAFHGGYFDPGATLLIELGRFRFHDPTTTTNDFLTQMIEFADADAAESRELGGSQVEGDNPWRANFEIRVPEDEDDD